MSALQAMIDWLNDPLNWTNPDGILVRLREHLLITVLAVFFGALIAWPLGVWLGRRGSASGLIVVISNVTLAIPVTAMLTILPLTFIGFGKTAVVVALAIFAIPPLLANAYIGVHEIDPEVRESARGMGLSEWQTLARVELPLAVPYLATGLRIAVVQVVATAALASFVNGGGLGQIVSAGFGALPPEKGYGQVLAGALLITVLALLIDALMALAQRRLTPANLRRATRREATTRR